MTITLTDCTPCIIKDKHGIPERLDIWRTITWIKENVPVRTILETGEILFYRNGIYVPGGEQYISKILVNAFGGINKHNEAPIYNKHVKSEILTQIRDSTYTSIEEFDSDLEIINTKSGLYNWVYGTLEKHTPDYYSVIQIPVNVDPEKTCPNIDKMINTVCDEKNRMKCYEFIAYCLYRKYPIQKGFILFGPGGTGKSYFLDIVQKLLGSANYSNVSMQDLGSDRFASSDLYMKMANICGDLGNKVMYQVEELKKLTSGKDVIRAQKKGEKAFEFVNFAKLLFASNVLPASKDGTTGFYRRFEIIPFMHIFSQDEIEDQDFLDSLTSDDELSGLFNKVVKILPELLEKKVFSNQLGIADVQAMYKDRSQSEESFFEQFVQEMPGQYTPKSTLVMYFSEYCKILGMPKVSGNSLGRWIIRNISWIQKRAYHDGKDSHMTNYTTTINGKSVAAWPDTYFDLRAFIEWKRGRK